FAVGAVVMDVSGVVHDEFSARCRVITQIDPWVKENVLPAIADMPVTHDTYVEMREAFWAWYLQAMLQADYVVVSNGYPVEYRFLLDCQEADLTERYWQHPFPILDLTSLLLQVVHQSESKHKLSSTIKKAGSYVQHHPLHDAKVTALMAFEAFRQAGQIK
ncbi:MAG TPA: hypothetical protein VLE74_04135, partial [Candidatus Saccharimonadales bacterium]|nr:hypothetical protein [Candidatus Saccharimonadales bacterium]